MNITIKVWGKRMALFLATTAMLTAQTVYQNVQRSGALTATRVPFVTTGGVLVDDADLTFSTDTLTFTKGIAPTSLLVGASTGSLSKFTVVDTGTTLPRGILNIQINSGTDSANFSGYKARGTLGSESTIATADILANFRAWGHDGTQYIESGSMRFVSSGTIATNRVPSQYEIWTSTNAGPSVLTKAVTVDSAQNMTVVGTTGVTTSATGAGHSFHGGGTITGSSGAITLTSAGTNQPINNFLGGTAPMRVGASGDTYATTGALAIGSGTNSAKAINFGNDTSLFRDSTVSMTLLNSNASQSLGIGQSTNRLYLYCSSTETVIGSSGTLPIRFQPGNGTTTLTLDSSLNATFAKWAASSQTLATTSTDGLIAQNATAATSGVAVQMSPRTRWQGSAWNSSGTPAAETDSFIAENLPATAAGTTTATWKLRYANSAVSAGAYSDVFTVNSVGNVTANGKITSYDGIATAGAGAVVVRGAGTVSAQTAAVASVATYTTAAADADFMVSANVNVTTSSAENFTVTCAFTDETNTPRTATMNFKLLSAASVSTVGFTNGAVPYLGLPLHIRCKASTTITIATTGTFTGATYNASGVIQKLQ